MAFKNNHSDRVYWLGVWYIGFINTTILLSFTPQLYTLFAWYWKSV